MTRRQWQPCLQCWRFTENRQKAAVYHVVRFHCRNRAAAPICHREVSEYVALDIGLIGPDCGSETKVSICAKDNYTPYDRALTTKLIHLAGGIRSWIQCGCVLSLWHRCQCGDTCGEQCVCCSIRYGLLCIPGMERCHIQALCRPWLSCCMPIC